MEFRLFRDGDTIWSTENVREALAMISIDGCLDLNWSWSVKPVDDGWRIGVLFVAPDRDTMASETQAGRDFYVPSGATLGAVAKTAFTAIKLALEHELLEGFKVAGYRPFDPHTPVVPA